MPCETLHSLCNPKGCIHSQAKRDMQICIQKWYHCHLSDHTTEMKRRSQNFYSAVCNGIVSHGVVFVFVFFFVTHAETNANKMHWRYLCALQCFMCVIFTLWKQYMHTWRITIHDYFDHGETPNTPNRTPYQDKDGSGSGISSLYL